MAQDQNENWQELCKAAANELDPVKLMDLITKLNGALEKRDQERRTSGMRGLEPQTSGVEG
jgi:hypothetical protein